MTIESGAMRRRLRVELKRLRTENQKTQREVASALDWSPSKVIRIENGSVSVSVTDLRALLDYYELHDRRRVEEFVEMARNSKKRPWAQYKDLLPAETIQYLGYVSAASTIRQYQTILMPGLLQTEDYTRALMAGTFGKTEAEIDGYVDFRQEYREILTRPDPPQVSFVLDEAIIRRAVGGQTVMRRQLEHLGDIAKYPNVELRILPFTVGAHFGMKGPFTYLEFSDPELDDVIYMEDPMGTSLFRDDPEVASRYLQEFWELERIACKTGETDLFLKRAIARLPRDAEEFVSVEVDETPV
jgi:transcriptional regulator with XRE-family HTH domain